MKVLTPTEGGVPVPVNVNGQTDNDELAIG